MNNYLLLRLSLLYFFTRYVFFLFILFLSCLSWCSFTLGSFFLFIFSQSPSALNDVRLLWWRPTIATVLHSAALKFIAFAPSVRLIKFWCSCQLFPLDQFTDLIEFLTLYLFTSSPSHPPPTTPYAALGR